MKLARARKRKFKCWKRLVTLETKDGPKKFVLSFNKTFANYKPDEAKRP